MSNDGRNKGGNGNGSSNDSGSTRHERSERPTGINKGNVPRMENPPKPPKRD